LISFVLLGIEEIGNQIEDPFGHNENDLPLDIICKTVIENVEELINHE
jgi:ion channel-forming bestrophin family protein